jgi:hypothetical protein
VAFLRREEDRTCSCALNNGPANAPLKTSALWRSPGYFAEHTFQDARSGGEGGARKYRAWILIVRKRKTSAPAGFAALLLALSEVEGRHRQSGGPAAGLQIQPEQRQSQPEQIGKSYFCEPL